MALRLRGVVAALIARPWSVILIVAGCLALWTATHVLCHARSLNRQLADFGDLLNTRYCLGAIDIAALDPARISGDMVGACRLIDVYGHQVSLHVWSDGTKVLWLLVSPGRDGMLDWPLEVYQQEATEMQGDIGRDILGDFDADIVISERKLIQFPNKVDATIADVLGIPIASPARSRRTLRPSQREPH